MIRPGHMVVKPYTVRCVGCGGTFQVPEGYSLDVHHLVAHDCPDVPKMRERRRKAAEAAALLVRFV